MRRLAVFLSLLAVAPPLAADAVDDHVRAWMEREGTPGLSLAVNRHGRLLRAAGYGLADVEHQVAATPETVYQSGSLGKQFTAAGVLLLAERGALGLDDPLTRHFPTAPRHWRDITVRHLLHHTSGLKDYGPEDIDFRRDYTEDELLEVAYRLPLDFPPGSQWSYSNSGYLVLGILIGRLAGRHWSEFLADELFAPLAMDATRVISEADIVPHRAAGYWHDASGALKNQEWVAPSLNTLADGSLYLTVIDLAKWDAALAGGGLLSAAARRAWWTPAPLAGGRSYPYGFGWRLGEQRGRRLVEHGGAWQGFTAHIARYVEDGLTVIVLTNSADSDPGALAHGVAGLLEPALAVPDPSWPARDADRARTHRLRRILDAWAGGRRAPGMAAGLEADVTGTARDREARRRLAARLAAATSFRCLGEDDLSARPLDHRGEQVARIVYCRLAGEGRETIYRFYLNRQGQVVDFLADAGRPIGAGAQPL